MLYTCGFQPVAIESCGLICRQASGAARVAGSNSFSCTNNRPERVEAVQAKRHAGYMSAKSWVYWLGVRVVMMGKGMSVWGMPEQNCAFREYAILETSPHTLPVRHPC